MREEKVTDELLDRFKFVIEVLNNLNILQMDYESPSVILKENK